MTTLHKARCYREDCGVYRNRINCHENDEDDQGS